MGFALMGFAAGSTHRRSTHPTEFSPRVPLVRIPGGLLRIVRAVVDLQHDGLLVCDCRSMDVALWVAVEATRPERDAGRGVFVAASQTEHELVRRMIMRPRDAGALVE